VFAVEFDGVVEAGVKTGDGAGVLGRAEDGDGIGGLGVVFGGDRDICDRPRSTMLWRPGGGTRAGGGGRLPRGSVGVADWRMGDHL